MTKKQRKELNNYIIKTNNRIISKNNFFENTYGVFKICKEPRKKPDYVSSSGSKYYYIGEEKIIRGSDHWSNFLDSKKKYPGCGNVASCYWALRVPDIDLLEDKDSELFGKIEIKKLKNTFPKMMERNFKIKIFF